MSHPESGVITREQFARWLRWFQEEAEVRVPEPPSIDPIRPEDVTFEPGYGFSVLLRPRNQREIRVRVAQVNEDNAVNEAATTEDPRT